MAFYFRQLMQEKPYMWGSNDNHVVVRRHDLFANQMIWASCIRCRSSWWIYNNQNSASDKHAMGPGIAADRLVRRPDELLAAAHECFEVDLREAALFARKMGGHGVRFRLGTGPEEFANLTPRAAWDYRSCASLFGYAFIVHLESGGVCQYCRLGDGQPPSYERWRQLAIEHVIDQKQGGTLPAIAEAVTTAFHALNENERHGLIEVIHTANTITVCGLCNSFASQSDKTDRRSVPAGFDGTGTTSLGELVLAHRADPKVMLQAVLGVIDRRRTSKAAMCSTKAGAVREAFNARFLPALDAYRRRPRPEDCVATPPSEVGE